MNIPHLSRIAASLAVTIGILIPAAAQEAAFIGGQTFDHAPVPSRIVDRVDDSQVVRIAGGTHPLARAEFDRGTVNPQLPMDRMTLILKRSPEQEAALEKFMARQLDPKSADYHHWLKPAEFGALYGPSDSDIGNITSWLLNHGFSVDKVSNGRVFIEFSGTARQVAEAFHTEIHNFVVNGEKHVANNVDPSIPAALRPVVVGIYSLHNFQAKPMHRDLGAFRQDKKSGQWIPVNENAVAKPMFNIPGSGTPSFKLIAPYDFAAIYNVAPLWTAGIDGTGQTIAIAGRSDVSLTDVANFRSFFGLPVKAPTIIVNGTDPGIPSAGDKVENTLDVEWSGAVAKNATIKYVTTKSTNTSDGASASAMYIIDNNVAPVMSFSYGNCELAYGTAGNAANNSLWQQAAAQGITAFVASGDQGAAACDGGQTAPYGATFGLAVSGASTTPYNVAVGGTDLNWINSTTVYWNTTNAANGSSAKGYMLEVPWNGTCASNAIDQAIGATSQGLDAEQTCQAILNDQVNNASLVPLVNVVGGTGGKSACTTPSSNTVASCSGGYAKPSWQTGTGVPADGKRDVPDVSLFASGGSLNTAYAICDSDSAPCTYTNTNDAFAQAVGGTSVASPAMAGIMALVNQKMGAAQGNANVAFYALAAKDNRTACNSNTVAAGNACNFYDITTDNIAVPCVPGKPNCTVHHTGDGVGILNGYTSTTGYDLATGLGTVNANNLVNNWSSVVPKPAVSLTPTSLTFASTAVGATTAAQVITIKNTGTAALTLTSETITGTNATSFVKSATTCTTSLTAGASCTVSVQFKPTVAGALTASLSIADNATGSPHTAALSGTATTPALTVSVTPATLTFASTTVGITTAAQVVTIKNTGASTVTLTSETITGTNATSFAKSATTCTTTLAAAASCTVSVTFKPTAAGALTANLSVADNATGSPQLVALKGTGVAPLTVSLTPASLTFASTTVGVTSAAQIVTIKNTGTATVTLTSETITGTNATSFAKSATTCTTTLAAAATCTVSVTFKPTVAGALTANLSVADNATGSPQLVTLKGTGVAAGAVTLTPASIAFPATVIGTTSDAQVVTLTNSGTTALTISSITLGGTNATSFIDLSSCGTSLAASASCSIYVAFKPATAASFTGTLSVTDNATGSPQKVTLTGTGTTAPSVKLSVTSLAFPTTKVGATSAAKPVTLTNLGTATLNLTSITLAGANPGAYIELDTCGATLAHAATCTVYIAFKPTAVGAQPASLSIVDNGAASPQTVTLTGTGN